MTDQDPKSFEEPSTGRLAGTVVDLAVLAGSGSITYGVWLVFHPAAFIIGGTILLVGAWLAARQGN